MQRLARALAERRERDGAGLDLLGRGDRVAGCGDRRADRRHDQCRRRHHERRRWLAHSCPPEALSAHRSSDASPQNSRCMRGGSHACAISRRLRWRTPSGRAFRRRPRSWSSTSTVLTDGKPGARSIPARRRSARAACARRRRALCRHRRAVRDVLPEVDRVRARRRATRARGYAAARGDDAPVGPDLRPQLRRRRSGRSRGSGRPRAPRARRQARARRAAPCAHAC